MANQYEHEMKLVWHDVDIELPSDDIDDVPCLLMVKQVASKEADKRDMLGWRVNITYFVGICDGGNKWTILGQPGNGGVFQENLTDDTFCKQRVLYWAYLPVEGSDAETMLKCIDPDLAYNENREEQ